MIRKLVRQMLVAQIVSALTVSVCLLIDNIMIGRFLGVNGLAAYGWANPLLLIIGAVASMLSAGVQVVCSKSLGSGSQEETNKGYSSAVAAALGVSLLLTAAVIIFRDPLATMLGAGSEGEVFKETSDYLAGFVLGAPGSMGALVLVPFMQMAGQSNLLIAAVLGMTVADVALDFLSVFVFHGGMFGMGLASSLSYYVAMCIGAFYFCSKRCVFRFSLRRVTGRKMAEILRGGVPAGFTMASSVLLVFALNRILEELGGHSPVAAYAVIMTIGNAGNCITTGIGGVSLTLSGIFFHEEDGNALRLLVRRLSRHSVRLGLAVGALLAAFAPAFIGLFIPEPGVTKDMAVTGLRLFALGLIPCCLNNVLKYLYQGTGRVGLTEVFSLAEGALLPVLAAWLLSRGMGVTGVWLFFAAGETLALVCLLVLIRCKTGRLPWKDAAYLLLKKDFGVSPENFLEVDIHSLPEVTGTAQQVEQFCLQRGGSPRLSSHLALCVEEVASNAVTHGFGADDRQHHLFLRVMRKPDEWILRFRDDCRGFDPVSYVPEAGKDGLGLRLVRQMAREARYTYSLNLNNLTLHLPVEE